MLLSLLGSLRRDSTHAALQRAAIALAPPSLPVVTTDLVRALPHFDPDLDVDGGPPPVREFRDAVRAARGLLFITPEYNYSVPGPLKNAIDWASRGGPQAALRGKPAAIISGSPGISGGMRMQYQLRQILVHSDVAVLPQPEVILPKLPDRLTDGELTDPSTRDLIARQLAAFERWIAQVGTRAA